MNTPVDVRKYGETVREQGKASFEEAGKLMRAWVGATDLAYQRLHVQVVQSTEHARARVDGLQARAKEWQAKRPTRADIRKQVRETYDGLAERGEKVIHDLRTRPQVRLIFARTEQALKAAEKTVEAAEKKVEEAEHKATGGAQKRATSKAAAR